MNRLERQEDFLASMVSVLDAWQAKLWTAIPAILQSFDPSKGTCACLPSIQAQIQAPDGARSWVTLPMLVDCPVIFPGGGGFALTFPLKPGDEVLVILANRCIDAWWQSGGVQVQADIGRMHDLSDGFALPDPRSLPRAIPGVSTDSVQLRSNDGTAFIEIDEAKNIRVETPANVVVEAATASVTTTGETSITAPTISLTGDVSISGAVSISGSSLTHNGTNVGASHKHGGVVIGGSQTSTPV